jgi:ribonuclease Z
MNHVTILGSAFAIANSEQDNAHLLLQSNDRIVMVDCGNNPVGKVERAGVKINEVTDLVLTHAHADHMGALPLLLMDMWLRKRRTPLQVYGLAYTLERAHALLDVFAWQKWAEMFQVEFTTVNDDMATTIFETPSMSLVAAPVLHLIPTIGLRATFKDIKQTVVYSCDTEPCEGLDKLAANANVLIQEAAGPGKGHTSPEQAGLNASRAGVKKLILIHYDSGRKAEDLLAEAGRNFKGEIALARDLMVVC